MQQSDINTIKRQLDELLAPGVSRLPHGLLLVGPRGIGKAALADGLVARLLCERPAVQGACGSCPSCALLAAGNHPDLRRVSADEPEEEGEGKGEKERKPKPRAIRIDRIRELEDFVFVGSHRMGRRLIVISDAEAMNAAAANALLKLLEEPPATVYFILITSNERALLPTIRSRCRIFRVTRPDIESAATMVAACGLGKEARRWLALAAGAPLRVSRWQEDGLITPLQQIIDSLGKPGNDPLALAARWEAVIRSEPRFTIDDLLEEIQRWLHDLGRHALSLAPRYHVDTPGMAVAPGAQSLERLTEAWQDLIRFRGISRHPLNQLLFLESIANRFLRAIHPGAA